MTSPQVSPDVARVNFAAFVDRALRNARSPEGLNLTDRKIAEASGVATSTFHRWRKADWSTPPKIDKIRAFCEAAGASFDEALRALGMTQTPLDMLARR